MLWLWLVTSGPNFILVQSKTVKQITDDEYFWSEDKSEASKLAFVMGELLLIMIYRDDPLQIVKPLHIIFPQL